MGVTAIPVIIGAGNSETHCGNEDPALALAFFIVINAVLIICLFARYAYIKRTAAHEFKGRKFLSNLFVDEFIGIAWPTIALILVNGIAIIIASVFGVYHIIR